MQIRDAKRKTPALACGRETGTAIREEDLLSDRPGEEAMAFGESEDIRDQQQDGYEYQDADELTACRRRIDGAGDGRVKIAETHDEKSNQVFVE
ncbi:MAG TPA: hypothetical protein VMV98_05390 [Acidobacteriaceae bacterium]|nr:hypothetical protein [Acidobacteriaceae bacterium]